MQSPDDYDFDDPHHQADLDGIIERLLARRRADRSRLTDPLSRMMDILSDPFKRTEEPTTQVEKPRPKELAAAHTLDEMRANLGARQGTRRGRKVQPMHYEPTLDLKLIEEMYNRGDNLDKIRAHLRVGMARLHLEISVFLPHLINERRGRRPKALDPAVVVAMRAEGKSIKTISCELKVSKQRLVEVLEKHAPHLAHRQTIDSLKVKQLRARGFTQARIAEELGCSEQIIYKYLRRIREREKSEIEQVTKPLPEELPAASTVEELRAHLGRCKGTRSRRKEQPFSGKPTLDLELIERLFNEGATIHQIRAALHVGSARFRFEILTFLPHIAEAANKRRGRKSRLPPAIEEEQVKRLRALGWGWKRIAAELIACHKRLMRQYGQPSTTSTTTPTALK